MLHHLAHLLETLEQLVDILDGLAAASGDASFAAAVDDLGVVPLLRSHRQDQRFKMLHLVALEGLVDFGHAGDFVEAGEHIQ